MGRWIPSTHEKPPGGVAEFDACLSKEKASAFTHSPLIGSQSLRRGTELTEPSMFVILRCQLLEGFTVKKRLIYLLLIAGCSTQVFAQQKLTVGFDEAGKPYRALLTAIYKDVGLVPEFVLLPLERSMRSVNNGEIDADIGRAAGSVSAYPNAIETTESVLDMHLMAVVRQDFKPTRLSLRDLYRYRLGRQLGAKLPESTVKSLGLTADIAATIPQLLQMLSADRIDVVLNISTHPLSEYPQYAAGLVTLPEPLHTTKVVHVLNKKWSDYAPRIDAAIKAMKADGRLTKLLNAK